MAVLDLEPETILLIGSDGEQYKAALFGPSENARLRSWILDRRIRVWLRYVDQHRPGTAKGIGDRAFEVAPDVANRVLAMIQCTPVRQEDIDAEKATYDGMVARLWLAFQAAGSTLTFEQTQRLFAPDYKTLLMNFDALFTASFPEEAKARKEDAAGADANPTMPISGADDSAS